MKYLSFLLGAVALLAVSCSNDEVIKVSQPNAIGFETFVDKSTRATDITDENIQNTTGFAIWGVTWNPAERIPTTLFFGNQVSWNTNVSPNAWTYAPEKFWSVGDSYRFTAIAPYINRTTSSSLTIEQSLDELPEDIADIKGGLIITFDNSQSDTYANTDLCYAFKTIDKIQADQQSNPVNLEFEHMLSRVKFTFKNGFESRLSAIKISNLRITDAQAKATINKVNDEKKWTPVGSTTFGIDFTMQHDGQQPLGEYIMGGTPTPDSSLPSNAMESDHHYIFPLVLDQNETGKVYTIYFKVSLYDYDPSNGGMREVKTYDHTISLPAIDYQPNYSYNFEATIDDTNINSEGALIPIKFNPSVTNWKDFTDQIVDVPVGPGIPSEDEGSEESSGR